MKGYLLLVGIAILGVLSLAACDDNGGASTPAKRPMK